MLSPPPSDSSPGPSAPGSSSGTPPPIPSGSGEFAFGAAMNGRPQLSYPVLHFAGVSHGGNGNETQVKGSVRMTADGHVRWRFVSVCHFFPPSLMDTLALYILLQKSC